MTTNKMYERLHNRLNGRGYYNIVQFFMLLESLVKRLKKMQP